MDMPLTLTPEAPSKKPFSLPSIYEAPTVALSMAMDGGLSWRGMKAAINSPEGLTPRELYTYAERLKDEAGRNPISDSLIDVVSNPFVWLWVATAPWSSAALAKAGKPIFSASERALAYTRTKFPWLGALLAPSQAFADTAIPAVAHEAEGFRHGILLKVEEEAKDVSKRVTERLGVRTLNYEDLPTGSDARDRAERFSALWTALQEGHDSDWTQQVAKMSKGGSKVVSIHHSPKASSVGVRTRMSEMLGDDKLADELVTATRKIYDAVRTTVVPDEQAAYRILRTIVNPNLGDSAQMQGFSKAWINAILDRSRGPLKGASDAEVMKLLRAHNVDLPLANKFYQPHNLSVTYSQGAKLSLDEQMLGQEIRGLSPSISAFPSSKNSLRHGPRYWQILAEEGVLTDHGQKFLNWANKTAGKATQSKAARFLDHNPMRGMERYVNDMSRVGFLAQDIRKAPAVLYANARSAGRWASAQSVPRPGVANNFEIINEPMSRPIEELIGKGRTPTGGFTVADALNADLAFIGAREKSKDGSVQSLKFLREYVIPRLKGQLSVERGAANFVADTMGSLIGRFADVWGPEISKMGPGAAKTIEKIKRAADTMESPVGRSIMSSNLTKMLYSGHLASPSSVFTNMMQPLNAVAFLPAKDVAKGYARAWGQVFNYMEERFSKGLTMSPEARNALIKKHIPLAEEAGILRSIYDMEEEILKKNPDWMSRGMDLTLKGFEKAEWANRIAVVEAVASRHNVKDMKAIPAMVKEDMRQATEQINFASSWWNTPMMFQKGTLSDPLLRMFMTFPLRMLTYGTYTLPNLVDEGKSFVPNMARMMGFSTVAYLTAKNLFGTDISKGLFYAGATDILPFMSGGRFEERESAIPIPPIIDIPANAFKGLLQGDGSLIGDSVWRTIPGGVFARRLMNYMPQISNPAMNMAVEMQRSYVDWNSPQPDGTYPLYTRDGALVETVTPGQVLKRAVFGGMAEVTTPAQEAKYLIKQRDQMNQYRQQYLSALMTNQIPQAQSLKQEFEQRFKMPMSLTKQQLRTAQEMRNVPRTGRMVERMPAAVRASYANMLTPRAPQSPVTPTPLWSAPEDAQQTNNPAFGSFN